MLAILSPAGSALLQARDAITEIRMCGEKEKPTSVYVICHPKHSTTLVPTSPVLFEHVPEARIFKDRDFVEFGFGDKRYYFHPHSLPRETIGFLSGFWPTPAVVEMGGLRDDENLVKLMTRHNRKTYRFLMNRDQVRRLCAAIGAHFARSGDGPGPCLKRIPGRFGSRHALFKAHGTFSFATTCNAWTAGNLRAAGFKPGAVLFLGSHGLACRLDDEAAFRRMPPEAAAKARHRRLFKRTLPRKFRR